MSSWLDHLPSHERAKIRARLRSPEEYERLRERVKGPEDLERELKYNESLAEMSQDLHKNVESDIREKGIDHMIDHPQELSPDTRRLLEEGKFRLLVEAHPESGKDVIMILPEGKPAERLPLKPSINEQYISQIARKNQNHVIEEDSGLSTFYS